MSPKPATTRQELEELWRSKLEAAQERYNAATKEYRRLLQEVERKRRPNGALERARHAESLALAEYSRVLRLFTDLTVRGRIPEEPQTHPLIAVVDDDESIRDSLRTLLRSAGYRVVTFESGELFLQSGVAVQAACLILDVRMPEMDGPQLQERLKTLGWRLPIIFITAHDDGPVRQRVLEAGATDVLQKPFQTAELLAIVAAALEVPS